LDDGKRGQFAVAVGTMPAALFSKTLATQGIPMSQDRSVTARSDSTPYVTRLSDGVHAWSSDTLPANGGADAAEDPESLVLGALGACTAITVRMYAARKQWPLQAVDVKLQYTRRDNTGTTIERSVQLIGPLDAAQRQRLLEIADKCPIHRLLTGEVVIQASSAESPQPS
jgi:putative redox protein